MLEALTRTPQRIPTTEARRVRIWPEEAGISGKGKNVSSKDDGSGVWTVAGASTRVSSLSVLVLSLEDMLRVLGRD